MLSNKIIKFIYIGVLNTIVYYILYSFFLFIGLNYEFSVIFATMIGVIFNFKTFSKYVFGNDDNKLFFKFITVYIVLFLVNILFINIFNLFFDNYYISGLIAIFPYSIVSYYLNDKYVFEEKK